MNKKFFKHIIGVVFLIVALTGCGTSPALPTLTPLPPTQTPIPPTATPIPPTDTPLPPTAIPYSEFVEVNTIQGPGEEAIASLALSPDGSVLAYGSYADKLVHVVDTASGKETMTLEGHTASVSSLAFSPDGSLLASTGTVNLPPDKDGSVRVWDMKTGKQLATFNTTGTGELVFSPDGKILAGGSGGAPVKIRFWDTKTFTEKAGIDGVFASLSFSTDGKLIVSRGMRDSSVHVVETDGGKDVLTIPGNEAWVQVVAFSPDGNLLASGNDDNALQVWDAKTGEMLKSMKGQTSEPSVLAFSPDSTVLASLGSGITISHSGSQITFSLKSGDGLVRFWDVQTGSQIGSIKNTDEINAVAFSPDWTLIATGTNKGAIQLWNVKK